MMDHKEVVKNVDENCDQRVLEAFIAGSISGTCSTMLFQPLDLVKTRLQSSAEASYRRCSGQRAARMVDVFVGVIQKENFFGLWTGITPSLLRCVPGVGIYFASFHWMKSLLTPDEVQWPLSASQAFAVGVSARVVSVLCLLPITIVKTRFESGEYKYTGGVWQTLVHIRRTEGIRTLASGLTPTVFRDAAFSGLYQLIYSWLKRVVHQESEVPSVVAHFTCGLTAGLAASVVTHPADVAKTEVQLHPGSFPTTWRAFTFINKTYGVRGYFRGLVPRMLRRALIAAMSWTIYEQMIRSVALD